MSKKELLTILPPELKFPFELKKQSSCSLQLVNNSDHYVAFKVKTTSPKKYCVRPCIGVVLPMSSCDVIVTMQSQREAPPDLQWKDKFLVQSVVAPYGVDQKDITKEMFNKEDGKVVEECKLRAVYALSPQPLLGLAKAVKEVSELKAKPTETWVLKVQLQCKKSEEEVRELLRRIDGVDKVHIGIAEQKVTVKAKVASDVLLENLRASGRDAELWSRAVSDHEKQKVQESGKDGGGKEGDKGDDDGPGGDGNKRGGGGGVVSSVMGRCLLLARRMWKYTHLGSQHEDNGQTEEDNFFSDLPRKYEKKDLLAATNKFHEDNKLGEGGFGCVYKGIFRGKEIAVKKLKSNFGNGIKDFKNEIMLLAKLQHRNLVKLLGYCAVGSEIFIVCEYLPELSLDRFLLDANKLKDLDWAKRRNIIIGVAQGLRYLHKESRMRIVHRDIKPHNILLDKELNPKIANFGIAKHFANDETHLITSTGGGTMGYMAPECLSSMEVSPTADVFSFGVVLLQLVTGRNPQSEKFLASVRDSYERGKTKETIDSAMIKPYNADQVARFIQVGLLCTQTDPLRRPCMDEVIQKLSK